MNTKGMLNRRNQWLQHGYSYSSICKEILWWLSNIWIKRYGLHKSDYLENKIKSKCMANSDSTNILVNKNCGVPVVYMWSVKNWYISNQMEMSSNENEIKKKEEKKKETMEYLKNIKWNGTTSIFDCKTHLGMSFQIEKSNGFVNWCNKTKK